MRKLSPEKRDQILRTATKLFLENGLANTTMNDIAFVMRCSKATLYNYFPSKEDLFEAFFEQHVSEPIYEVLVELDNTERSDRENLFRLVEGMIRLRFNSKLAPIYHQVIVASERAPHITQLFLKAGGWAVIERSAAVIERLMKEGVLREGDPIRRARQLQILITVENNTWNLDPSQPKPDEETIRALAKEVTSFFWAGAAAHPEEKLDWDFGR